MDAALKRAGRGHDRHEPPIDRMNRKTSTEPNSFPGSRARPCLSRILDSGHPVDRSEQEIPNPAAEIERRGQEPEEPATGLPAASSAYWPEGMKKVAIQTRTRERSG